MTARDDTALWIDVYTADGTTLLGNGPITDVIDATITRVLDGPGTVNVSFPATSKDAQDLVDNERVLVIYKDSGDGRREVGRGIARDLQAGVDAQNTPILSVYGPDLMHLLESTNLWLAWEKREKLMSTTLAALIAEATGWTLTQENVPQLAITARADGASVLRALQDLATRNGQHLRYEAPMTVRFGPMGTQSSLVIQQAPPYWSRAATDAGTIPLVSIRKNANSEQVWNRILPIGGGQGEAAITLKRCTRAADRTFAVEGYTSGRSADSDLAKTGSPQRDKLAQSFQFTENGWITGARLLLIKKGAPAGTMTLRIETDSGGSPSGTLVHANATATLAESGLSTKLREWKAFTFTAGFYATAGTTYWLVLSTSRAAHATNYVKWGRDHTSPAYTTGQAKYYASSAWSAWSPASDQLFEITTTLQSLTTDILDTYEPVIGNAGTLNQLITSYTELDYTGATFGSSHELAGYEDSKAFDGNPATEWRSGETSTEYVQAVFPAPVTVNGYRLHPPATVLGAPGTWVLNSSTGAGWNARDSQSGITFQAGIPQTFLLASPITTDRYWQLTVASSGDPAEPISLAEFDLLQTSTLSYSKWSVSFSLGAAHRIKKIKLWLRKHGTPLGNLTVKLETDSGGSASGTVVTPGSAASDVVAESSLGAGWQEVTFTFASPVSLAASTTYHLTLNSSSGANADNWVEIALDAAGSDAGSVTKYYNSALATWYTSSYDALFELVAECIVEPYAIQTMTGPDGTTLYYLEDADSVTAYGAKEQVLKVEISAVAHNTSDIEAAANALYDASSEWLKRHKDKMITYTVVITNVNQTVYPGERVRLDYEGEVVDRDGATLGWCSVHDWFWITRVEERHTADGGQVTLDLSSVDRAFLDDIEALASQISVMSLSTVFVQPFPAVFTNSVQDVSFSNINFTRNSVNVALGRRARIDIEPDPAIVRIQRIILKVSTRPMMVQAWYDNITDADEADVVGVFAAIEDTDYPASIHLFINGVDVSASVINQVDDTAGPWLTEDDVNQEWTAEIDITDLVLAGGADNVFERVVIELEAGYRNITADTTENIPSFAGLQFSAVGGFEISGGIFLMATVIHAVTQAVRTNQ